MNIRFEWVDLPCSIPAWVAEQTESDGEYYTVMLNINCSRERIEKAIRHELSHIENNDFNSERSADEIELIRHNCYTL